MIPPPTIHTGTYDQLAIAFCKGQIHLLDTPSRELLNLSDPYDPKLRKNLSYVGDASLYNDQYYFYWGPVPSLLLCGIKFLFNGVVIGDEFFVLIPVVGTLILFSLLAYEIQKKYFHALPTYLLIFGMLLAGLANPFTWILNSPYIYGAAVASGQFLVAAGIYSLFIGIQDGDRLRLFRIFLGGCFLAMAIGTRFTQILPAAIITLGVLAWYFMEHKPSRPSKELFALLFLLIFPQLIMGIALASYNYVRFGSILEFGLRYQLAFVNMHKQFRYVFSPLYLFPNLYNYLLNPFTVSQHFPYILPQYGKLFRDSPIPFPRLYFSESITGMLFASPILLFSGVTITTMLKRKQMDNPSNLHRLQWLKICLTLSAFVNALVLLFFFDSAERYSIEVICFLIPLLIIGLWEGYTGLSARITARKVYLAVILLIGIISILNSSLLAFSSTKDRFLIGNPALMNLLIH